ncbi:MAG TPA: hypothetical protein VF147_08185 [Vicinamibacterales bacterium]
MLPRVLSTPISLPRLHRRSAHIVFACVVWPLLTIVGAAVTLFRLPYYAVTEEQGLLAGLAGTLLRLPDMLLVGAVCFGGSFFLFRRLGADARPGRIGGWILLLEPAAMFVALVAGMALWYPAVLSQPLLALIARLPAAGALMVLWAVVALCVIVTGRPGKRFRLAAILLAAGVLTPGALWLRTTLESFGGSPPSVLVLGVDSLSFEDDIGGLRNWTKAQGGTWYEHAVAPGLLTNAVWSSILTMEPVRTHGVFHAFQRFPAGRATFLDAARAKGYRTISVFPDQLTCAVGSRAGFDEDRSGPVGWRQLLLPIIANNSFLLPVVGAALPRPWPGASPSNESGTFTYDVRREIRALLRAGESGQRTMVVSHLTYTHLPAFPSSLLLSWKEIGALLRAPAWSIVDRSLDWQDRGRPEDPLPLRSWKLDYLLRTIESEVGAANYLGQGGQLVLLSDHGDRDGLFIGTFTRERYHHVILATFGLPSRCADAPISLIDVGALLGLRDQQSDPSVEFILSAPRQWPVLVLTAHPRWRGDVDLDEKLLGEIFRGLQRHRPWSALATNLDASCRPVAH